MRPKTSVPKAAPAAKPSSRKGLGRALGLITLVALGFAAWSWHQSSRPGAVHLQAGLDSQAAHDDARAEQEWRAGTQQDPSFADDYARLGDLYLGQKRFEEAAAQYQAGARLSPRDATLFVGLTRAQIGAHKMVEALDAAQKAMALRPDDPDAAGVCGMIASKLNNSPLALTYLRRAHQLKPDDANWTLALARQELDALDLVGAERELTAYLKARPDDGEANRLMALLYKQKPPTPDNVRAGVALAEKACRLMPDSPDAFLVLGQIRLSADQIPEALKAFQTAYSFNPVATQILNGLVTCYSRLHDTARAARFAAELNTVSARLDRIEHLRTILKKDHGDLTGRLELARLEEENGNFPAAQGDYDEAERQAPNDPRVRAALAAPDRRHRP